MNGRPPKPTKQHIAEGDPSKHGVHKLEEKLAAEPKATPGLPSCPKHLAGRARAAWKFWSEELEAMKLDKRPDAHMLEGACVAYDRAVAADLILAKEGLVVRDQFIDESGEVIVLKTKKHPAVEISNRSWILVKAFCGQFGFDPVSRTRLAIPNQQSGEDDELLKALSAPREPSPSALIQ